MSYRVVMQEANPIRRGHVDQEVALAIAGVSTSDEKSWYAVCPTCEKRIMYRYSYPYYARATRKNTKDALYRHLQKTHEPGSVGR